MKVVFITGIYTHHQRPFAEAMNKICDFTFIETTYMANDRKEFGYKEEEKTSFLAHLNEEREKCEKIIDEADVIIFGSASKKIIDKAVNDKKLVIKCTERIFKIPPKWYELPLRAIRYFKRYRKMYLLCPSAYTASDYAKTGAFKGKAYKWGYFPEVRKYPSIDELISQKQENSILWCGRFLDWKHPELAIFLAKNLKEQGYNFTLNMIGIGEMKSQIEDLIKENQLEDYVKALGSMSPELVRNHMEKSQIYIATSDRKEGWGAVVNEAMNSACAVVASNEMGSVPYLIKDGENGHIYYKNNEKEFFEKVKSLLDNKENREKLSKHAYETICDNWNGSVAAERLLKLLECLLNKKDASNLYENGICSPADKRRKRKKEV